MLGQRRICHATKPRPVDRNPVDAGAAALVGFVAKQYPLRVEGQFGIGVHSAAQRLGRIWIDDGANLLLEVALRHGHAHSVRNFPPSGKNICLFFATG